MTYQEIQAFIFREARLLDDRQWDDWLTCYHPKCEYWMPAWDDDDNLTTDPTKEISLIYYPNRNGLEDRVYRIKTERSGASMPEPRTTHQCANLEILTRALCLSPPIMVCGNFYLTNRVAFYSCIT